MPWTTQQIAQRVQGRLAGPGDLPITGVETLDRAAPGQITFIRDAKFAGAWAASKASAALAGKGVTLEPGDGRALIFVDHADLALVETLKLFAPPTPKPPAGVHPTATVDPSAQLGGGVAVGPGCRIGPRVRIGDGTLLHANVTILDDSTVGAGCEFWPGVVVRERCTIGDRCLIHPNAVIGADGFGFTAGPGKTGAVKIPHIGTVVIGHDVEIGACTTIDRAKFSATVIGDGTKLDNLVQIAHNVRLGRSCLIAAQVAIAGSAVVGDGVVMGGQVGVRDHVTIGSGVTLAASSAVMGDIPAGETWAGIPAQDHRTALREILAIRKLPELARQLRK